MAFSLAVTVPGAGAGLDGVAAGRLGGGGSKADTGR